MPEAAEKPVDERSLGEREGLSKAEHAAIEAVEMRRAEAKQETTDFVQGVEQEMANVETRYDLKLTPSEAAEGAQLSGWAKKLWDDLAQLEAAAAAKQSAAAKPLAADKPVEAYLGEVIPEQPVVKHDVTAELTTPPPDAAERYKAMTMEQLQAEYERLHAATEANLKADPKLLKAYAKAAKKGGEMPEDKNAENADIDKVYAEIQARRRGERVAVEALAVPVVAEAPKIEAPIATHAAAPAVDKVLTGMPGRVDAAMAAEDTEALQAASAAHAKSWDGETSRVEGLRKRGDLASLELQGNLTKGMLENLRQQSAEELLQKAVLSSLITPEDRSKIIEGGHAEAFKRDAETRLANLSMQIGLAIEDVKASAAEAPIQLTPEMIVHPVEASQIESSVPEAEAKLQPLVPETSYPETKRLAKDDAFWEEAQKEWGGSGPGSEQTVLDGIAPDASVPEPVTIAETPGKKVKKEEAPTYEPPLDKPLKKGQSINQILGDALKQKSKESPESREHMALTDKLAGYFEDQLKDKPPYMAKAIRERTAAMSPAEMTAYIDDLRKMRDGMDDETLYEKALVERTGLSDGEIKLMEPHDFDKSRALFKELYAKAVGIAEAEAAAKKADIKPKTGKRRPQPKDKDKGQQLSA